ncbi:MAG TPA: Hsp20/alpha crystallin family protein [Candidatus Limnocylindrales bacterium]|nr:Hsp20/alpha crystallin family protein [Candidatus Limnocylindrales bacterium]
MSTIVRWAPARDFNLMQRAMDRMFDESWRNAQIRVTANLPVDVYETDSAYTVVASLPGVKADALTISMHDGVLTIAGELVKAVLPEDARALVVERGAGKFSRSLRLPEVVEVAQIEAVLTDGVLTLSLPKTAEAQPRMIPVRQAETHSSPSAN